jgi:uncharacterized protein (TIGR01244 family)
MLRASATLLLWAWLTPLQAAAPMPAATQLRVADNVTVAGLLDADAATRLRGTETVVIDLRLPDEGTAAESHAMWRAGVVYINLPTTGAAPTRDDVELFDAIVGANAGRPILVHCASGNRAGMVWAAHLLDGGTSLADAKKAVRGVVTKASIDAAIDGYAAGLPSATAD